MKNTDKIKMKCWMFNEMRTYLSNENQCNHALKGVLMV